MLPRNRKHFLSRYSNTLGKKSTSICLLLQDYLSRTILTFFPDALATRSEVVRILVQHLGATQETETCLEEMMPSKMRSSFYRYSTRSTKCGLLYVLLLEKTHYWSCWWFFWTRWWSESRGGVGTSLSAFLPFRSIQKLLHLPLKMFRVEVGLRHSLRKPLLMEWRADLPNTREDLCIDAERIGGGESGERVKQLQRILTELEFFQETLMVFFFWKLKNSVLQYQLSRGILQTQVIRVPGGRSFDCKCLMESCLPKCWNTNEISISSKWSSNSCRSGKICFHLFLGCKQNTGKGFIWRIKRLRFGIILWYNDVISKPKTGERK